MTGQSENMLQYRERGVDYRVGLQKVIHEDKVNGYARFRDKDFSFDITELVRSFSIEESIYYNYRIGQIELYDLENYSEYFPITGNDVIIISYKNKASPSSNNPKTVRFRVFIDSENPLPNQTTSRQGSKLINLRLVEYPFFDFFTFNPIYKTFPINESNTPTLSVSTVLRESLNTIEGLSSWCEFDFEESLPNFFNYFIPNWSPIKLISKMKDYAVSEKGNYGNYLFYIRNKFTVSDYDKPILVFRPHYLHIEEAPKRTYGKVNTVNIQRNTLVDESNKIRGLPYTETDKSLDIYPLDVIESEKFDIFDGSKLMNGNLGGGTDFTFDYINGNKYYSTDFKEWIRTEHKSITPYCIHSHKGTPYGNQWSRFNHSGWSGIIAENITKYEDKNKYARSLLKGGIKCHAKCKLYEQRSVGEACELFFPSADTKRMVEYRLSGTYLTEKIVDVYDGAMAYSIITFASDSFGMLDTNNYIEPISRLDDFNQGDAAKYIRNVT